MNVIIFENNNILSLAYTKELNRRGHIVKNIFNPVETLPFFAGNCPNTTEEEVFKIFYGCEGIVFDSACQESELKDGKIAMIKILKTAKSCGVKKAVIIGSVFSYFAKLLPYKNLCKKYSYVRNCIEQEKSALSFCDDNFEAMILEMPFLSEASFDRVITSLFDLDSKYIFCPGGGTTMVTLRQMGESVAGALEKGTGGSCYPVGMYNKKWKEILNIYFTRSGKTDKKIISLPLPLYKSVMWLKGYKIKGINTIPYFADLPETYISKKTIKENLGVLSDDFDVGGKKP
jgi:hypothetical protein